MRDLTVVFLRQLESKKQNGKRIFVVGVTGEVANQQLL
jgi:hypothetical protein